MSASKTPVVRSLRLRTAAPVLAAWSVLSLSIAASADAARAAGAREPDSAAAAEAPSPAVLRIQADRVTAHVAPGQYGLMTEEINYSYDGGLYAELVRNRAFRDDPQAPVHWSLAADAGATGSVALDPSQPLNKDLPTSLRIEISSVGPGQSIGAANDGYWGIPVRAGTTYRASFYAKAAAPFSGSLGVTLESADGRRVFARGSAGPVTSGWRRFELALKAVDGSPDAGNRLVLRASAPGTVWLQLVSLFPPTYRNRANGNRRDIMEKLAALKPGFLRFPGGNYLEGDTFAERFDWKATLGDLAGRPGHRSPWGYRSTDGMGLLEFLEWCEDLTMQPVLAVFAGYSLKHEVVPPGPGLQPYVQDALDEIEYVTGGAETRWGARRAADGHPAPFPLTYVEIGNEDWFDRSGSYDGRFAQFFDAIKAAHPGLQLIATTPVKSRRPDVLDEHFYRRAQQFYDDVRRYDSYDRKGPRIFVGEWATREGSPTPNMNAALGDTAWMTGMERNADIVVMDCYAPLFVNVNPGGMQWRTDLIGYDAMSSYGSPSYYAHLLFNTHRGDGVVASDLQGGRGLFASVTRDSRTGLITVKMVNSTGAARAVRVSISGAQAVGPSAHVWTLSSVRPTDTNSIADPVRVVPVAGVENGAGSDFVRSFPAYSFTVLELTAPVRRAP